MSRPTRRRALAVLAAQALAVGALGLAACGGPGTPSPGGSGSASAPSSGTTGAASAGAAGTGGAHGSVYAQAGPGMLTDVARRARPLVYVPNTIANTVQVVDPATYRVIREFRTGAVPQHVVPSWDLTTLWVNVNVGNALVPIDPVTGREGRAVAVDDPYNLYFTPDGAHALVMAEREQRIDVRDPHTMALQRSLTVPCRGVNHADYTADLSTMVVSCEFSGKLLVIPADLSRVSTVIDLNTAPAAGGTSAHAHGGVAHNVDRGVNSMPQDVRLTPDGRFFLAADMLRNGVWKIDATTFRVVGLIPTGAGAHGIYPSRDASVIYVSNRDAGTISVLDATTLAPRALWRIPGGGSPDMGGVTADGRELWLSGRSNGQVYVFDTATGRLTHRIATHAGSHGLCVWPQPGRFSLGHTGNTR